MKYLHFAIYTLLLLAPAQSAFSQNRFAGQVVDIIDGRTIVIDVSNNKITAVLQHIEVPEPGQPLNSEVVEHLRGLLLGKVVEFKARTIINRKTIGRVFLNNVDISQQMLRDGAAWLAPAEITGQDASERGQYSMSEAEAKTDKLGVWSIKDMKPAWEYRAQKVEKENRQPSAPADAYRFSSVGNPTPGRPRSQPPISSFNQDMDIWADVMSGWSKESVGLLTNYNAAAGFGSVVTSATFLNLTSGGGRQKLEIRAIYAYRSLPDGGKDKAYLIGFQATSREYRFARTNSMTVVADGERFALGQAKRFSRQTSFGSQEMLFYRLSRKALTAIASARKAQITIGAFTGALDVESQSLMLQLLDASE